jgi:hypothetical protein
MKNMIIGAIIALSATTALSAGICRSSTGVEVMADGSVVRTKLPLLLNKLLKDATPQARLYSSAVSKGVVCPQNQCVSVVIISRDLIKGPAQSAQVLCRRESI